MIENMRIVVVTPTYNELDNMEVLVKKIFSLGVPNLHLFIVDDNSPDGTGIVADQLSLSYPITVIHRSAKKGIGPAYIEAFKKIIADKSADVVIQMDADLSHDPADIPRLLAAIDRCDLVLGSRYVAGGGTRNWGFLRRLISRFGSFYSRSVLSLPYRDLTGGFKCFRRGVLEAINLDSLSSLGYNFQIETTYAAHKKGFRICEVPICFTERAHGKSKFNLAIIVESFFKVIKLRLRGI